MTRTQLKAATAAILATSVTLAGCGGGPPAAAPRGSGPVTITWWSWDELKYLDPVVAKFNATHDRIKLKVVKQADNPGTAANLRNVVAAGQDVPCLVKNFGEVPGLAGEGLLTDVTEAFEPYTAKGLYNAASYAGAQAGGRYYGVPSGFGPSFMMINRAVYDKHGIAPPRTWDELVAAGKQLKKHGVYVMNLAGEDPSTLVNLVQQAGGSWYRAEGDTWKVDFLSPESLKAAQVVQQLVDNDLAANQTYQDRPALISYFDSGKMVSLPTSTWQLANYELNYKKSLGDWQPVDLPQFADAAQFVTPAHGGAILVPKGCAHVKEAVEAGVWMATSKDAVDASYQQDTKQYSWPGAVPDPSPWIDSAVPEKLFGARRGEAEQVILKAVKAGRDPWTVGPNYTGVFAELQDQWARIVTKKITVRQALEHLQKFTVDDLKAKNINVQG
ncbi:extracellular solute-binding protein [Nonomuraea sp. NPDC005650]|uniref:ABC transporter substrate-binding protein n=1 Tax=Nonomuraea sp. NPDC005650 TaxID=3157045 RepID=UPI0033BD1AF7